MKQIETQPKQILFGFVSVRTYFFSFEDTLILESYNTVESGGVEDKVAWNKEHKK